MAQQITETPAREQRLRMTYDEFLALDDHVHAEWVNGEVTIFVPSTIRHARVVRFLVALLSLYAERFDLGEVLTAPVEMRLVPGRSSREPDILFVARAHADRLVPGRLEGPADLVIELISDDSVTRDRRDKFAEYEAAGVPEYWIVDPRERHERANFYRLGPNHRYEEALPDAAGRYHAAVLPGFWLDPTWLWQTPLPKIMPTFATITSLVPDDAAAPQTPDGDRGIA